GTERGHLAGHRGPVVDVAYGPDGRVLASASTGASVATRGPSRPAPDVTPVRPAPARAVADPGRAWNDLAGDPRAALAAARALAADPDAAVALIGERLR